MHSEEGDSVIFAHVALLQTFRQQQSSMFMMESPRPNPEHLECVPESVQVLLC